MVLGPRPLADAAGPWQRQRVIGSLLAIALLLLVWTPAPAADSPPATDKVRVTGRVYEEARTSRDGDRPLTGATIVLVPRSEGLLARLNDLRARARDSAREFRSVSGEITRAAEEYQSQLKAEGKGNQIFRGTTSPDGTFSVEGVPRGHWILLATSSVRIPAHGRNLTGKERQVFRGPGELQSYDAVTIWIRELNLTGADGDPIALSDRNAWLTGVQPNRAPGSG
jgi:hypothetical protein